MLQAARSLGRLLPQASVLGSAGQSATFSRITGSQSSWAGESCPSSSGPLSWMAGAPSSDDKQRATEVPAQQRLANMASMLCMGMPTTRSSSMGTFASTPVLGHRAMSTLGARPSLLAPKGLGLGLASRPTIPAAGPVRTLTDGQLLGNSFMLATDVMFWSGLIGAVIFRRNLIVMLLATEIVMLACNLNFLFASAYLNDMTGVIMSITITTIAACETAIGLALCVTYFHLRSQTDVEALNFLK